MPHMRALKSRTITSWTCPDTKSWHPAEAPGNWNYLFPSLFLLSFVHFLLYFLLYSSLPSLPLSLSPSLPFSHLSLSPTLPLSQPSFFPIPPSPHSLSPSLHPSRSPRRSSSWPPSPGLLGASDPWAAAPRRLTSSRRRGVCVPPRPRRLYVSLLPSVITTVT